MNYRLSLNEFLRRQFEDEPAAKQVLPELLKDISAAAKIISCHVREIGLLEGIHRTAEKNIQGEEVNSLDLIANNEIRSAAILHQFPIYFQP